MAKRVWGIVLCLFLCAAQTAFSHAETEDTVALYQGYTLSRLTIRAEPSTDAEAVGYYNAGDAVLILSYEPTWLKVQKKDAVGYVLRHLVKVGEQLAEGTLRYGALPARHAASLLHNAPLYELPDVASATVANLPEGARIAILSIQDGWAKLIYNRQYAYLHVSHLVDL
ncbi:MAG TPA: SH3 domain-containing protein, partial [Clostridia bacterium]|nr:SH3 domain-containing protein [Clostridia bacterium]